MGRTIRIVAALAAIVAVISLGTFFYLTRGIAAPTQSVQSSVQELNVSDDSSGQVVYRISQDNSSVEYTLTEVLNGSPKTVVGTTTQVAGDILVDSSDLAQSQIGEISISARTFATDDSRRDNSVARFILQSEADANEFITFTPTAITGLSGSAAVGDMLTFQVTGDLTIAGTTKSVTFDVTAALNTDNQLVGSASTTVQRSDFNLTIPSVPFVANVGTDVTLKLSFVANAVSAATEVPSAA